MQNEAYGQEAGFKTILQLAIEEDDGAPYVEELLKVMTLFSFSPVLGSVYKKFTPVIYNSRVVV